ncbi:MAG: hypothetical protein ACREGC_01745, partial [Minisyncoccia bacterium]
MKFFAKIFSNKKALFAFTLAIVVSFLAPTVFAVWNGTFYDPGATLNPECTPDQTDCNVRAPLTSANIDDTAFGAGWNADTTHAPSKNSVYDEVQALIAGSSSAWGSITGTLSDQTDLQNALNAKQDSLISGTNIKTINGASLLGAADIALAPALTADENYVTDAQLVVIGNTSGTNTGDQDVSGLVPYTGATGNVNIGSHNFIGTGAANRIGTATTADSLADSLLATSATTQKGLVIQGKASQTANLQEWQKSNGTVMAAVRSDGEFVLNNTAALQGSGSTVRVLNTSVSGWLPLSASALRINSTGIFGMSSGSNPETSDTGLSRVSAGVIGVGNGTAGDVSGTLEAARAVLAGATIANDNSAPALKVTATLPTTPTADVAGGILDFTGAGSAGHEQHGLDITLEAGYTGSQATHGLRAINHSNATGTNVSSIDANFGIYSLAQPTTNTTGTSVGVIGQATPGGSAGGAIGVFG